MPIAIVGKLERKLAKKVGKGKSVIRELADLLDLSVESVYRRFRGATSFTLNELWLIRQEYGISIDKLMGDTRKVDVEFKPVNNEIGGVESRLIDVLTVIQYYARQNSCKLTTLAADVPLFRLFGYNALTQFKLHYWTSTLGLPMAANKKFQLSDDFKHPITEEIHMVYMRLNVVELWADNTLSGTLKQFEYYVDSGLLTDEKTIIAIYRELLQLVYNLVYHQPDSVRLYQYELTFNNNTFHIESEDDETLAIGIHGFNSIQSTDTKITREFKHWLSGVMEKSLKISGQSEKQKFDLCRQMKEQILKSVQNRVAEEEMSELKKTSFTNPY